MSTGSRTTLLWLFLLVLESSNDHFTCRIAVLFPNDWLRRLAQGARIRLERRLQQGPGQLGRGAGLHGEEGAPPFQGTSPGQGPRGLPTDRVGSSGASGSRHLATCGAASELLWRARGSTVHRRGRHPQPLNHWPPKAHDGLAHHGGACQGQPAGLGGSRRAGSTEREAQGAVARRARGT